MNNESIKTELILSPGQANTISEALKIKGTVIIRAYKAGTKELVQEIRQSNLIMVGTSTGQDWLINWLLSGYTTVNVGLGINYGAIGTGTTAPNALDTQLQTETNRVLVAYGADLTHTQAQLQFFFPDGVLANGTYHEFGMFIQGTAAANSGNLFNHALFSTPYTKAAGTDTTIECIVTFA